MSLFQKMSLFHSNADVFAIFTRIFSTVSMDFSAVATGNPYEKVLPVALYFGLFLRLQWKVTFFYSYGGNPKEITPATEERGKFWI